MCGAGHAGLAVLPGGQAAPQGHRGGWGDGGWPVSRRRQAAGRDGGAALAWCGLTAREAWGVCTRAPHGGVPR